MIATGNCSMTDKDVEQHALGTSIVLHLLPGVLMLVFFVIVAPLVERMRAPSMIAYALAVFFVQIPFELGLLYYLGKRRNGTFSLEGIVHYRESMPRGKMAALIVLCIIWLFVVLDIAFAPIHNAILTSAFGWLPEWFFQDGFMRNPDDYSQASLVLLVLLLWIAAVPGPLVEELYFRGYLLPRLSRFGKWSPLINTVLFSLEHLSQPWQAPGLILGFLPTAYVVWWKKNLKLGIIVHCIVVAFGFLFITMGVLALLTGRM
jgi:membrane protease YdiL (CAAX protease family)